MNFVLISYLVGIIYCYKRDPIPNRSSTEDAVQHLLNEVANLTEDNTGEAQITLLSTEGSSNISKVTATTTRRSIFNVSVSVNPAAINIMDLNAITDARYGFSVTPETSSEESDEELEAERSRIRGNISALINITTTTTEKPWEPGDVLKDIAYYLRAHKFNEYDRRYETHSDSASRRYYKEFPRPPLRSLHWEVHKFCELSFSECIEYLRKKIRYTSLKRVDDTAVVMQEQNWTFGNNSEQIKQIDDECKILRNIDNTVADPFEGPLERFQWRTTASYYMCWYTMKEIPELEHLSESCDNFAYCLDDNLGPYNRDHRANDRRPYSCALYSFCPDPCCPSKHLTRLENCWNMPDNPCFQDNPPDQRECAVNRSLNTDFRDIILNRWNVTCRCPHAGYEWNSLYGMCIDVDECAADTHDCDLKLEACVNLPGSFRCACKWGHVWDPKRKRCAPSAALGLIKLGMQGDSEANKKEKLSILQRIGRFFGSSNGNMLCSNDMTLFTTLLFILVLIKDLLYFVQ